MRSIPPAIKAEIFRKYLEGYSTTDISKEYNVSVGSVSSIITEKSQEDNDFFQIREITKIFIKYNLDISDVISGIRLNNKIKQVGLNILFFENFLEATNTESFRLKKDHDKFLEEIKRIVQFEELYGIKIEKILVKMAETLQHLQKLRAETKEMIEKNKELYLQHSIKKSEIEEYLEEKPLFLQYKLDKWRYQKRYDWFINPPIYEEVSKKIGITVDPKILYKKLHQLFLFPYKHKALIKKIMTIEDDIFKR
jgi:hypothetical protein